MYFYFYYYDISTEQKEGSLSEWEKHKLTEIFYENIGSDKNVEDSNAGGKETKDNLKSKSKKGKSETESKEDETVDDNKVLLECVQPYVGVLNEMRHQIGMCVVETEETQKQLLKELLLHCK